MYCDTCVEVRRQLCGVCCLSPFTLRSLGHYCFRHCSVTSKFDDLEWKCCNYRFIPVYIAFLSKKKKWIPGIKLELSGVCGKHFSQVSHFPRQCTHSVNPPYHVYQHFKPWEFPFHTELWKLVCGSLT